MPETERGIWYPDAEAAADVPVDMKKAAESVDGLLGEVDLSQLVATEEDDGKLVIVKDGAAAYKAMSGDVTITEDGVASIGTGKVTESKLGNLAVSTGKINNSAVTAGKLGTGAVEASKLASNAVETAKVKDKAITLAKLAEALGLTEGYLADGAVTSRKAKLTTFSGSLSEDKIVTAAESWSGVSVLSGTEKVVEFASNSLVLVSLHYRWELRPVSGERAIAEGALLVDGEPQTPIVVGEFEQLAAEGARRCGGTWGQSLIFPVGAGARTLALKTRLKTTLAGEAKVLKDNTGFSGFAISQ